MAKSKKPPLKTVIEYDLVKKGKKYDIKKLKELSVQDLCLYFLLQEKEPNVGFTYGEILEKIKRINPNLNTSKSCLSWYVSNFRTRNQLTFPVRGISTPTPL